MDDDEKGPAWVLEIVDTETGAVHRADCDGRTNCDLPGANGPAMVNSPTFRSNWDGIFGAKPARETN